MKNAIILHLYYTELWEEFSKKLKQLTPNFDLYITLVSTNIDITDSIKKDFPDATVFKLPNKGTDVGPFIYVLNYILQNKLEYFLIYKMHGKKSKLHGDGFGGDFGDTWRNTLIDCLIGSNERYNTINSTMESNQYIGMCGAEEHLKHEMNNSWLIDAMLELNVRGKESMFIAGTMFVVRFDLYKSFFEKIDLVDLYESMPYGYSIHGEIMHKLERIFGYIVTDNDFAILALKTLK